MAVKTKDEIISAIVDLIGDNAPDEHLAILEDVTDTLTDYETRYSEDWESKYKQLDADWRKRYIDRFNGGGDSGILELEKASAENYDIDEPEEPEKPTTYEELFEFSE